MTYKCLGCGMTYDYVWLHSHICAKGELSKPENQVDETKSQLALAQERLKEAEGKLMRLMKEAQGFVSMADPATHGNTNIAVMNHHIKEAQDYFTKWGKP